MRTDNHKSLIIAGFCLAVLIYAIVWVTSSSNEPSYGGKKLSVWLDEFQALDYTKRADTNSTQVRAVRTIGTNAIPWLIDELSQNGSALQWRLNQLLNKQKMISYRFPDLNKRLSRASLGFKALGELGEPAIPTLLSLVEGKPGFVPGALAGIGVPAVPALQQCLTNSQMYTASIGQYAVIPGNTIADIFNAVSVGSFPKSNAAIFLPTIRAWAQQSTNQQAQSKATWFFDHYDQLR